MIRKIITVLLLLLLVTAGAVSWSLNHFLMPMHDGGEEIPLVIPRGMGVRAIGDTLEALGVVRSSQAFFYLMRFTGLTERVRAGNFTFVAGEGAVSAADKLPFPQTVDVTLRVLEGLTVEQIAAVVQTQLGIDSAAFVNASTDSVFIASLGVDTRGTNTLEGYLFPDTYRLPENVTPEIIIRRMVARFNDVIASVDWAPYIREKYNVHQIITLASIVEKEATRPDERGKIAGVFHNRLVQNWPLGADPTVRYIFRKFDGPLYVSELNNPSPYNTRRFRGLPPGPICSPGRGAIQATVRPDTTDAMFFVALWDGSGRHYFSRTNEEHDRMKFRVRRENEERIRQQRAR